MANEGAIKINYFDAGENDITCKILKPDDTVRDTQTAVALDDTGHANLYTNNGPITIEAGDSVVPYKSGVNINAAFEYIPEVTVGDKTGFSLSTPAILAIWHQLTAAVVTVSTMGKLVIDFLNATITSRAPANEYDTQLDVNISTRATPADVATALTTYDGPTRAEATSDKDEIIVEVNENEVKIGNIQEQTDKLNTMIIEDSAGNQFTEIALVNTPTGTIDPVELAEAMKAITGLTVGGTWTWEKIMKITTAFVGGNWRLSADGTKQELLDAEDGITVILQQEIIRSPDVSNKYRDMTVLI